MFKLEIKVSLDFTKIRVYIVHKMDGSIVKYTKYLKCESKHNNVRSLVVSRCGVCSKVLRSNPSACAIFLFYGYISIGNLGWCGLSGAATWAGVGWVELGCVGLRKKKPASAARSLVQSLNSLATFFWIINSQHLLFELLIVNVGCGFGHSSNKIRVMTNTLNTEKE